MGLDMYAFKIAILDDNSVEFDTFSDDRLAIRLHQWRKHQSLHVWMEQLYYAKSGKALSFKSFCVELTLADLDRLETTIKAGDLPITAVHFSVFGGRTRREDDLAFIAKALAAINEGFSIFYHCSW